MRTWLSGFAQAARLQSSRRGTLRRAPGPMRSQGIARRACDFCSHRNMLLLAERMLGFSDRKLRPLFF
jgi:hypothetical protein